MARDTQRLRRTSLERPVVGYFFILPMLLMFVVFRFGPFLASLGLSLFDYRFLGGTSFVGLENYRRLFNDAIFWTSLRVTVTYSLIAVPLGLAVAMSLALLVKEPIRGIGLFRSTYFLPVVTSMVMAGVIWKWVYSIDDGLLNGLLSLVGLPPQPWLQSEKLVLPSLAVMAVWKDVGYPMLILLAGIQAIPESYHEAAVIDGANAWQRFWRVTLPLLRPVLFFVLVIQTIGSFQVFDAVYVMTGGGPVRASYTLVYNVYDNAFKYFNFGYAAAITVVLFLLVFAVSLIQRRLVRDQ